MQKMLFVIPQRVEPRALVILCISSMCYGINLLLLLLQYTKYILQWVGLICANKPRWVWLASPSNALINAVVWQTTVYVNICAFTSLWQGEVLRAGKQHTAAARLMSMASCLFQCVCMCLSSWHSTPLNFDLTRNRCPWINLVLN